MRQFYVAAVEYVKAKLPFRDAVLVHAKFVNFEKKKGNSQFNDVEYFMEHYSNVLALSPTENDIVFDEFVAYKLLEHKDIPQCVWDAATEQVQDDELQEVKVFVRMDVIWAYIGTMKNDDGCSLKFQHLPKIAKLVLTLPHSNASEERVFSLIRLNKTPYRSSLDVDGTLSSILTVKLHNPEPCYECKFFSATHFSDLDKI